MNRSLAIYEPPDGRIWHGVGQDPEGQQAYHDALPSHRHPALISAYLAPHPEWTAFVQWRGYTRSELADQFARFPHHARHLALSMCVSRVNQTSSPWVYTKEIAEGLLDPHLITLAQFLAAQTSPVFLRPGFEFNGEWNGYEPESFVAAFRHIVRLFRENGGANVAFIWHGVTAPPGLPDWSRWYPGDDYVDWWGLSTFRPGHFDPDKGGVFADDAAQHGKPLMICESTPLFYDIADPEPAWSEWYVPFFRFIRETPNLKAFVYINQELNKFPMWKDFGDSRLHRSPEILARYTAELADPRFIHLPASPPASSPEPSSVEETP
ncbi:MAG: hypothetical protein OHK0029_21000 [Armatimonadaceae bacterium]